MLTPWELFAGAGLPGLLTLVVGLLAWRPWGRGASLGTGRAASTVALGGAFVLAWIILFGGLNQFPPTDATSWGVFLVMGLSVWGVVEALVKVPPPARIGVAMLGVSVFVYFLIKPLVVSKALAASQGASAMGGLTILILAWWASVELLERRGFERTTEESSTPMSGQNGLTSAGVLLVLTTTIAMVHGMSGSFSFSQKAGFMSAGIGGIALVALWAVTRSRTMSLAHGPVLVVVAGAGMLLATGRFYSEITWASTWLIVLIPFAPWLADVGPVGRWTQGKPVRGALVRIGLSAVPAMVALSLAGLAFYKSMQQNANNPYGGY